MKRVVQIQRQGKVKDVKVSAAAAGLPAEEIETKVALIQALIPLGLHAVGGALEAEVVALAGARYRRTGGPAGVVRWGQQRGSVYLADQKLPIPVPRVRDRAANREVALTTYEQLQRPRAADAGLFRKVLVGLTCRQYKACAEAVPEAFGLSASSVSRRFIRASARHLQTLCERRLDRDEFVALVLDGKTFAEDAMVIALGITLQGQKQILGFVQTATENERVPLLAQITVIAGIGYGLSYIPISPQTLLWLIFVAVAWIGLLAVYVLGGAVDRVVELLDDIVKKSNMTPQGKEGQP